MKSFEEYFDEFTENQELTDWSTPSMRECYEAGQQSQQSRIDELEERIGEALLHLGGVSRFINEDNPRDIDCLSVTIDSELNRVMRVLRGEK